MNYGNEILAELAGISTLLAGMEKINVFSVPDKYFNTLAESALGVVTEPSSSIFNSLSKNNLSEVPEGYFENLADIIFNKIKQQDEEATVLSPSFSTIANKHVFEVPNAYFENLADSILNKAKLQDEESTILSSELLAIKNKNIFEVPQGYFANLADTILNKAKRQDEESGILSPILYTAKKKNIFEVPQGYFENLSDSILNRIKQQEISSTEELKTLSPTLYGIKNENVFEIPEGYFSNVSNVILNKVHPQPAKVIKMHKRSIFFKYASAAMIAGIAALGIYKFANKTGNHNALFASLDPSIQNGIKMNDNQLAQALNKLSDDDIANYLAKNANGADMAEITSDIDENNLPNADQYLLDDKTLDNYLSNNNLNQTNN